MNPLKPQILIVTYLSAVLFLLFMNCGNDSSLETPTDGHPFPDISTNCLFSVTPNNSSPSHETTEILTNDPSPPELSDPTNSSQNL